ncbi:aldo/keto reductase [Chakrabartyella piscis]|uniref:aldo/keto reductase n=1 Tax=Chakrabartyella piscis TaxID=2918914 RepID=UPI0029588EA4|nr:aldo/keto reductase [Chakrabartyella piscis]
MQMMRLGKTEMVVNKNGFGALPIQRITKEEAAVILRKAYDNGINYFDTARAYSDSEEKIGYALSDVREHIFIATKTGATDVKTFWEHLHTSLEKMKTDYIDLYQFHNPAVCPKPNDGSGLYEAMLEAKEKGMVRHIGFTNHRIAVARDCVESGLYETLQFPFNYLSTPEEFALVDMCNKADMGYISMKALSGGLISNGAAAAVFQYAHEVLPIWGVQKISELDEFLSYQENPPVLTEELQAVIAKDQKELMLDFCRGCGYCMPCPVGIEINNSARMSLQIRRAPSGDFLTPEWQEKMKRIENCLHCGKCAAQCPYGLDTPQLLQENWKDYQEILAGKPLFAYTYGKQD